MQVKKHKLELDMEQWTGSKLRKEYSKGVYCHSAYLTFMQSASCEMLGWMNEAQAGIKTAGRNINNLRYADGTTFTYSRKWRTKKPLDECERGEWKSWLKTQHSKKRRSWHPVPSLCGKPMGKKWKQWETIFLGSKITVDGNCSHEMKKDACSLEENFWQT